MFPSLGQHRHSVRIIPTFQQRGHGSEHIRAFEIGLVVVIAVVYSERVLGIYANDMGMLLYRGGQMSVTSCHPQYSSQTALKENMAPMEIRVSAVQVRLYDQREVRAG